MTGSDPILSTQRLRRLDRASDLASVVWRKREIEKATPLRGELRAIAVPPRLRHPVQRVPIDVLEPHHLFQARTPVRASDAALLHATMRRFAYGKAGDHIVDHDRACLNLPRECFAAGTITGPDAGSQPEFRIVG